MGAIDDALFDLKLAFDRAIGRTMGTKAKSHKTRYCPACGTSNPEGASNCSKCYRSFTLYDPK